MSSTEGGRRRLLSRGERRDQLVRAAASAFAHNGFAATGLDDVARHAGVTRAIIYRHFASKTELYQAVLEDTQNRLRERVGAPNQYTENTVRELVSAACDDPDGFRLLFRHAPNEPEFAGYTWQRDAVAAQIADHYLHDTLTEPAHRRWVAALLPKLTIELILSWLDAGRPTNQDDLVYAIRATSRALTNRP